MFGDRTGLRCVLGALAVLGGCRSDAPPPGVEDLRIEDPLGHHVREGFVQLVPPVHLPSSSPDLDQVEIWVKLPDGATIAVHDDPRGRPTLEFPPGTLADRVEYFGQGGSRRIVDIRGTRIDDDGTQTFYVYRPTGPDPGSPLFGLRWAREDGEAHGAATQRLVDKLASVPPAVTMPQARRAKFLDAVRGKNACAGCHALARLQNEQPRQHGLVDRGTDRSGFFTPQTVLWDEVPLEAYSAHDRSWDDPSIEVRCGDANAEGGGRRCADGSIAQGRLRWDAPEPAAQARLEAICEGRGFLLAHMTQNDRATLAFTQRPCRKK